MLYFRYIQQKTLSITINHLQMTRCENWANCLKFCFISHITTTSDKSTSVEIELGLWGFYFRSQLNLVKLCGFRAALAKWLTLFFRFKYLMTFTERECMYKCYFHSLTPSSLRERQIKELQCHVIISLKFSRKLIC